MEKAMVPNSSTVAWKIPWMEEPGRLQSKLKKEMATHSSVLAWRIPGTGEPGGLPSMGSHRVWHDWSDLAVAVAVTNDTRFFKLCAYCSFVNLSWDVLFKFFIHCFDMIKCLSSVQLYSSLHILDTRFLWNK